MSGRAKQDPAGRDGEAGTELGSCSLAGCAWTPTLRAGQGGTAQLCGSVYHRSALGAERPLTPTPGTSVSPEAGTHTLAAPTYAGCLHPGLKGAAVPVPCKSGGTLQRSIAEDIELCLGHRRDFLLLGCSQVLQEASSARQGRMLARSKAGTGTLGKPRHATQHSQPRSTEPPCTGHTTSGTQRMQPPPSPAERQAMPPRREERDAAAPWSGCHHHLLVPTDLVLTATLVQKLQNPGGHPGRDS